MSDAPTRKRRSRAMQNASAKNDDIAELLQLKAILAAAIDATDSARDIKALSLEYREVLKDIRIIGGLPTEEESPADRARALVEDLRNRKREAKESSTE